MKARRKKITFYDQDGRPGGAVEIHESGSRGNRHYNPRRPDGPLCACGARWEPVCSNWKCDGRRVPLAIMRAERESRDTRRYAQARPMQELKRLEPGEPPVKVTATVTTSEPQKPRRPRREGKPINPDGAMAQAWKVAQERRAA